MAEDQSGTTATGQPVPPPPAYPPDAPAPRTRILRGDWLRTTGGRSTTPDTSPPRPGTVPEHQRPGSPDGPAADEPGTHAPAVAEPEQVHDAEPGDVQHQDQDDDSTEEDEAHDAAPSHQVEVIKEAPEEAARRPRFRIRVRDPYAPPGPPPGRPIRQSAADWWAARTRRQRFILTNGAALGVGAYTPGLLADRWDSGIPQLVLSAMHDAARTSAYSTTPLFVGGFIALGAAAVGGAATGFLARPFSATPTVVRAVHWFFVRVPVASALAAICLFTTH